MKKLLFIISIIPVLALGQSTDQNYVKTTAYKQATATSNPNPDVNVANVQVSYFDGLGRPIQQVAHKQSNSGKDIITHIEYDQFGRQTRDYLPYVSTGASLNYLPSAQTDLLNFYASPNATQTGNQYFEGTGNPFSEKQLESSPLNRVFKQAAPGDVWAMGNGKEIKFDYQTNIENEVKFFRVVSTWNASKGLYEPAIVQTSNYLPNQLYKTVTKDENWVQADNHNNTSEEFKDKEGKVVLKRTYNGGEKHDTYYIYDQFGNLTYVIPPLAEGNASQTNLEYLGYQYKYDSRNRLVEKKLPGKEWEFIVYDKLDRPIATGPAYNPYGDGTLGWMITQYDEFGRVSQTGWKQMTVNETERKNHQEVLNAGGNPFVLVQNDILTKNFYDNYTFAGAPTMPQTVDGQGAVTAVRGLQTGSWVKVLDTQGSTTAETSYTLYDYKYRPIRTRTTNFLGGYTEVDSKIDWAGKVEKIVTKHKYNTNATVLTTTETFTYSPQDKLVVHKHKINDGAEMLIAKNNYDELGQLIKKEVGGQDFTGANCYQKVDYKYNIRGWLKEINDVDSNTSSDLFAFKINYNEGTTPLYNGNISETYWKSESDNVLRKYEYHYDNLNRLLLANYSKPLSTTIPSAFTTNSYLEKIGYDKNGNITNLVRNGDLDSNDFAIEIDNLVYTYDTNNKNKLVKVLDQSNHPQGFKDDSNGITDPANDYDYDAYGNLIKDTNKEIDSITYNHLNLPVSMLFIGRNRGITYLYNALGQKIQKYVHDASTTPVTSTYMNGGFQYTNSVLNFFPHAEGYVNRTVGKRGSFTYNYVYQYKDHLGNNRLSFTTNPSVIPLPGAPVPLTILEENHYYPFGLKHTSYNTTKYDFVEVEDGANYYINITQLPAGYSSAYKYKYNGKEFQDELGLNMYDYGARNYDPALGRWMNIDPLAELGRRWSPYTYAMNCPTYFIDPDGMLSQSFIDEMWNESGDGETTWINNNNGTFSASNGESADIGEKEKEKKKTTNSKTADGARVKRKGNGENINYFDPDDKIHIGLYLTAENQIVEEGVLKIFTHGNANTTCGYQTVEDIEAVLYRDSAVWRNFVDNGGELTVILYSCLTADKFTDGSNTPIAEEFAVYNFEKGRNLQVIAPTSNVSGDYHRKRFIVHNGGHWVKYVKEIVNNSTTKKQ
ncbi:MULTISPECIES: DUF6443 domain-containing protein [unclassified Flavobacterium]|uniref:DUF6443 domain-containing protein n=1 Tax=unclassified Flavobacterium TaxID=196869 RepID=UPI0012908CFB|nr:MULTISPECIES: DUF6443 domain-containing protein [unclassified Flavobacterium]MQP52689.1 type IV secretion protein Rhs [Flavobacterium sp. LMO9]MQP62131.1 type IV secretion protein Rhs [Flavobacterium sp. LMO6]